MEWLMWCLVAANPQLWSLASHRQVWQESFLIFLAHGQLSQASEGRRLCYFQPFLPSMQYVRLLALRRWRDVQ